MLSNTEVGGIKMKKLGFNINSYCSGVAAGSINYNFNSLVGNLKNNGYSHLGPGLFSFRVEPSRNGFQENTLTTWKCQKVCGVPVSAPALKVSCSLIFKCSKCRGQHVRHSTYALYLGFYEFIR